jgi:hypothetical protein
VFAQRQFELLAEVDALEDQVRQGLDRKEWPKDDNQIMLIKGMHNTENVRKKVMKVSKKGLMGSLTPTLIQSILVVRERVTERRLCKGCQAKLMLPMADKVNISCYSESKALMSTLIYN